MVVLPHGHGQARGFLQRHVVHNVRVKSTLNLSRPTWKRAPHEQLPDRPCRVALVYPGDREARHRAAPEESRFLPVFQALAGLGVQAEPAVYHDEFVEEVSRQLLDVDAALVQINPIQGGVGPGNAAAPRHR